METTLEKARRIAGSEGGFETATVAELRSFDRAGLLVTEGNRPTLFEFKLTLEAILAGRFIDAYNQVWGAAHTDKTMMSALRHFLEFIESVVSNCTNRRMLYTEGFDVRGQQVEAKVKGLEEYRLIQRTPFSHPAQASHQITILPAGTIALQHFRQKTLLLKQG